MEKPRLSDALTCRARSVDAPAPCDAGARASEDTPTQTGHQSRARHGLRMVPGAGKGANFDGSERAAPHLAERVKIALVPFLQVRKQVCTIGMCCGHSALGASFGAQLAYQET